MLELVLTRYSYLGSRSIYTQQDSGPPYLWFLNRQVVPFCSHAGLLLAVGQSRSEPSFISVSGCRSINFLFSVAMAAYEPVCLYL